MEASTVEFKLPDSSKHSFTYLTFFLLLPGKLYNVAFLATV